MWPKAIKPAAVHELKALIKDSTNVYLSCGVLAYTWTTADTIGIRAQMQQDGNRYSYEALVPIAGKSETTLYARVLWHLDDAARVVTAMALGVNDDNCAGR